MVDKFERLDHRRPRLSASDYNQLLRLVEQLARGVPAQGVKGITGIVEAQKRPGRDPNTERVKNASGAAIDAARIVILTNERDSNGFRYARYPTDDDPTSHAGLLAVSLEAVPNGQFGLVALGGVTLVRVSNSSDTRPSAGGNMAPDASGIGTATESGPYVALEVFQDSDTSDYYAYARPDNVAGATRTFAEITKSLSRGELPSDSNPQGTQENKFYYVKLLGATYDSWTKDTWYEKGKIVAYDESLWQATRAHRSKADFPPSESSTNWEQTEGIKCKVSGYEGDLLQTVPWFRKGDVVTVYQRGSDWYIDETVTRVETTANDGSRIYSLHWNEAQSRAMAVFG